MSDTYKVLQKLHAGLFKEFDTRYPFSGVHIGLRIAMEDIEKKMKELRNPRG